MRGLAEYVMSGRRQAVTAALLIGIIPLVNLLSPVITGLVMLRKGPKEALAVMTWAILPLAGWAWVGDIVPLILLIGIAGLAFLLRETESWEFTLLASIAVGVSVEVYMRLQPELLNVLFQQMDAYLQANNVQGVSLDDVRRVMPTVFGAVYMFLAVMLLILTRWMQAALYNPGGFRQEFHQLRIEQKVTLLLIVLMLIANFGVVLPQGWVLYFVMPLLFSGIALVHGVVGRRQLSSMWLLAFYALLMLPPALQIVVFAAIIDSWYNFRARIQTPV
ncbi:MAG: hypothetical protein MRY76_01885 [Pseudomonadales bacterium]|nr:hypothetical protein [Pseudomonadales bacterium]